MDGVTMMTGEGMGKTHGVGEKEMVEQKETVVANMGRMNETETENENENDTTPVETGIGIGIREASERAVLHHDVLRLHRLVRLVHTLSVLVLPLGLGLGQCHL